MKRLLFCVFFFLTLIWSVGTCSTGHHGHLNPLKLEHVTIAELKTKIDRLANNPVALFGAVHSTYYISFFNGGFYSLTDKNGDWLLVTVCGITPTAGAHTAVILVPKVTVRCNGLLCLTGAEIRRLTPKELKKIDLKNQEMESLTLAD
ncbi:MAG: hypothetical protein NXI23_26865 [Bacteroidetes bacterium]|nr:hypothetical protein [Bacteroidota bacterium]